jgi:hypothetical protein
MQEELTRNLLAMAKLAASNRRFYRSIGLATR